MEDLQFTIEVIKVIVGILLVLAISYGLSTLMIKREKKQDEIRRTKNRSNKTETRN